MGERLTEAQRACLVVLAEFNDGWLGSSHLGWCNYGTACGVKRNVVRALESKGLAQLDDSCRPGVSARITDAGRSLLKENPNG